MLTKPTDQEVIELRAKDVRQLIIDGNRHPSVDEIAQVVAGDNGRFILRHFRDELAEVAEELKKSYGFNVVLVTDRYYRRFQYDDPIDDEEAASCRAQNEDQIAGIYCQKSEGDKTYAALLKGCEK